MLVAKYWITQNPFLATFPVHLKVRYLRELIIRYGALGMFTEEDPTRPIGWIFRKNGNVAALRIYTCTCTSRNFPH
jgi:hypothetical protein